MAEQLEQQKVRTVPTDTDMRELGKAVAKLVKEADCVSNFYDCARIAWHFCERKVSDAHSR